MLYILSGLSPSFPPSSSYPFRFWADTAKDTVFPRVAAFLTKCALTSEELTLRAGTPKPGYMEPRLLSYSA